MAGLTPARCWGWREHAGARDAKVWCQAGGLMDVWRHRLLPLVVPHRCPVLAATVELRPYRCWLTAASSSR